MLKVLRLPALFCLVLAMSFSSAQAKDLSGPKKTVAVVGFENASGISSYVNLGNDFTTQLSDALIQSGNFTVLSRRELSKEFNNLIQKFIEKSN